MAEHEETMMFLDSLKALLDARLAEIDRRYEQRFSAQEAAVLAALVSANAATNKAEAATDRRFESVNEFRQALTDQTATFITRAEAEARIGANAEKIADLFDRVNLMGGRQAGSTDTRSFLIASVGVLIGLAAVATSIIVAVAR